MDDISFNPVNKEDKKAMESWLSSRSFIPLKDRDTSSFKFHDLEFCEDCYKGFRIGAREPYKENGAWFMNVYIEVGYYTKNWWVCKDDGDSRGITYEVSESIRHYIDNYIDWFINDKI
jgi:hypothetical protein